MNTDGHKICELKKAEQRNAQFREMLAEQTIKDCEVSFMGSITFFQNKNHLLMQSWYECWFAFNVIIFI